MSTRAFITGVSGTGTERRRARVHRVPSGHGALSCSSGTSRRRRKSPRWFDELRESVGEPDAPVLIDQEGGRVQRLGPPHWPVYPPGAVFGALYDLDPALGLTAARLSARLIAADLIETRRHRRLPAAGGRAGRRRRCRDRQPGLWNRAGQGRGDRARGHGGTGAGRYFTGAQAHSRPWPGHRRHPFQASGGRYAAERSSNGPISPHFNRWRTCRWP